MIGAEAAREIVREALRGAEGRGGVRCVLTGETLDYGAWWVQGYQPEAFAVRGDVVQALAGNEVGRYVEFDPEFIDEAARHPHLDDGEFLPGLPHVAQNPLGSGPYLSASSEALRPRSVLAVVRPTVRSLSERRWGMDEGQTVDSMEQLARSLALELRSRGDVADDVAVTEIRDRPTPWLTLEFTLYDFVPISFVYDRGHAGFGVSYGSRSVPLLKLTNVHFDHGRVRVAKAVDDVLTAARLRIPDKFLAAHSWSSQQPTDSSTQGDV